jgi:hypothetical protein
MKLTYKQQMEAVKNEIIAGTITDDEAKRTIERIEQANEPGVDVEGRVNAAWSAYKAMHYTRALPDALEQKMMINLPMSCDADSIDVETWLIEDWKRDVTPDNFDETCNAFRAAYMVGPRWPI